MKYIHVCCLFLLITGCASGPLTNARNAFYDHHPLEAADILSDENAAGNRDRLLLYMEKGLILHYAGEYEKSIATFLKAAELMREQDIINLGSQAASLVTNDWVTEYKGEYAERLWVHTYLMMNYLITYEYEDALVEAKLAIKAFEKYGDSIRDDYFTRALAAFCFEVLREYNGAYIEYKKLASLLPDPAPVAASLFELGMILGFSKEARHYQQFIPPGFNPLPDRHQSGELILFAGIGRGPVKVADNLVAPPSIRISFPRYRARYSGYPQIYVRDSKGRFPATVVSTLMANPAGKSLKERGTRIMTKLAARAAFKEAIAQAVEKEDDTGLIGALVRVILFISEEADTRCWETLPGRLSLIRICLPPGNYRLSVHIQGKYSEEIDLGNIRIRSGVKVYRSIRASG